MKRIFKFFLVQICLILTMTSCGLMSDSETEKKIVGSWTCTETESEDGAIMQIIMTETYKSDKTYNVEGVIELTSPLNMTIGKMSYSGTWKATKTKLLCEVDKNSFRFSLSDILDDSDANEFKNEILKELKKNDYTEGGKIVRLTENELVLKDEDDEGETHVYTRVR